jgi:hypothetical protein
VTAAAQVLMRLMAALLDKAMRKSC